jgi:hypothetical protein
VIKLFLAKLPDKRRAWFAEPTVLALRFLLAGEDLRIAVEQARTKKGKAPKVDAARKPVYCSKIPTPSMPEASIHLLTREKRAALFL